MARNATTNHQVAKRPAALTCTVSHPLTGCHRCIEPCECSLMGVLATKYRFWSASLDTELYALGCMRPAGWCQVQMLALGSAVWVHGCGPDSACTGLCSCCVHTNAAACMAQIQGSCRDVATAESLHVATLAPTLTISASCPQSAQSTATLAFFALRLVSMERG